MMAMNIQLQFTVYYIQYHSLTFLLLFPIFAFKVIKCDKIVRAWTAEVNTTFDDDNDDNEELKLLLNDIHEFHFFLSLLRD